MLDSTINHSFGESTNRSDHQSTNQSTNQSINPSINHQSINQSIHQPVDPMRSVGLLGKLVFLSWLQSVMRLVDLEELLHFSSPLDINIAHISAVRELSILDRHKAINQSIKQSINQSKSHSINQ